MSSEFMRDSGLPKWPGLNALWEIKDENSATPLGYVQIFQAYT